jgi:hypothetical protein
MSRAAQDPMYPCEGLYCITQLGPCSIYLLRFVLFHPIESNLRSSRTTATARCADQRDRREPAPTTIMFGAFVLTYESILSSSAVFPVFLLQLNSKPQCTQLEKPSRLRRNALEAKLSLMAISSGMRNTLPRSMENPNVRYGCRWRVFIMQRLLDRK